MEKLLLLVGSTRRFQIRISIHCQFKFAFVFYFKPVHKESQLEKVKRAKKSNSAGQVFYITCAVLGLHLYKKGEL